MIKCGPDKDTFLSNYDNFIEKIDKLDLSVGDKEWERHDEKFRSFIEECYEYHEASLTTKERRKFWMKTLKYYADRYGEGLLNELSKEEGISEEVKNNLEDVLSETGRDFEDFMNKNVEQLEKLVNEIGKDIEDWATKIKEIFQE